MTLRLRRPTAADLPYRSAWMADPATMSYNAGFDPAPGYDPATGCIHLSSEDQAAWLQEWTTRPDRFVAFLVGDAGEGADDDAPPLGEVAFRVTDVGDAHLHLLVAASHAGRGIGAAALGLLVERAFARPDVVRLVDEFPPDREPAATVFRRLGFARHGDQVVLMRTSWLGGPGTQVPPARPLDTALTRTAAGRDRRSLRDGRLP